MTTSSEDEEKENRHEKWKESLCYRECLPGIMDHSWCDLLEDLFILPTCLLRKYTERLNDSPRGIQPTKTEGWLSPALLINYAMLLSELAAFIFFISVGSCQRNRSAGRICKVLPQSPSSGCFNRLLEEDVQTGCCVVPLSPWTRDPCCFGFLGAPQGGEGCEHQGSREAQSRAAALSSLAGCSSGCPRRGVQHRASSRGCPALLAALIGIIGMISLNLWDELLFVQVHYSIFGVRNSAWHIQSIQ